VEWLVAGTAAGDDPDLAAAWGVRPIDDLVLVVDVEVGMRGLDPSATTFCGSLMSFFMLISSGSIVLLRR
jgi:hypothetical protein